MRVLPVAMLAVVPLVIVGQGSANADVTSVKGSAYGYYSSVTVFGTPYVTGPTPTVTLPSFGSSSPITATAATGSATAGPATIFSSGPISISTQGTTGPTGSVTSSTNIQSVNTSGAEVLTASNVASSCSASESGGVTASTTFTDGILQTDNGDDDPTNTIPDHPPVNVTVPINPTPNTTIQGHIHIGNTTDTFRYVFSEQVVNTDGSITVNAAHEYLLGPSAVGDLIVGQSICGVTTTTPPPDTTAPRVIGTVPASNATGVSRTVNVKATFSEAMNASTVTGSTFELFKKGSTTKVAASVTYDAGTHRATLNPTNSLRLGTTYKALVTTFAADTSGNRLDQDASTTGLQKKTWFFKVRN